MASACLALKKTLILKMVLGIYIRFHGTRKGQTRAAL
jgi:hypothetical protein